MNTSLKRNTNCLPKLLFISLIFNLFTYIKSINIIDEHCSELKDIIHKPYSDIISYITKNINDLKDKQQSCIDVLVKNGKLEELDYYLNELAKKGIQYRESLSLSINTMKKQLDEINNKHRFEVKEYQTISPAFKWAQSLEDIFIEIKYAHRHDSPGCLEIKDMDIKIKNDSVTFMGYCVLGDVPIKIDFRIDTYKGLNVSDCTHGAGSVGRYQITLKKSEKCFWKKLLKDDFPIPPNMRVWFEMKEKFEKELKEFEEKEEKENEDNIDKLLEDKKEKKDKKDKKEKKKKKGKKKKGNKNSNETSSNANSTSDL
jgi:hypothetical protein